MSKSLEDVIQSDMLYEILRRVAQRALCSELLHFVLGVRMYKHFSLASLPRGSQDSKHVQSSLDINGAHAERRTSTVNFIMESVIATVRGKKPSTDGNCTLHTAHLCSLDLFCLS
jgi:hypothetical protein